MPDAEFILRIILRARDEMAGALAKARGELALLTSQSQQWRGELKRLNGELDNFFNRLDRFSSRATKNIRDEIDAHRRATSSSADHAQALGHLADEEEKASSSVRKTTNEVRRGETALRSHKRSIDDSANALERWGQKAENVSRNTKSWGDNVGATDNKLRGMIVAAALIFIQQLDSAVVSLGGGLVALAGSAAMAGGALGGILAAGAMQALPVVAELGAALHRVSMVWNVVQQAQKVAQQQDYRNIQSTKAQAGASDALKSAQEGLATAHRGVGVAEEALTVARREAKRQIQDLTDAEIQSRIEGEKAALAQRDAREALAQALETGDIDAAQRARIQLEEANRGVAQARTSRARAIEDANRARNQGVEHNPQVEAAKRSLDDANRAVADADRALKKARTNADVANADMFQARAQLQYMLKQLSPAEKELYSALTRIQKTYKAVFRPITDTIVGSFTFAVNRANSLLSDPRLAQTAGRLADSISARLRGITRSFTDEKTLNQFLTFTKEASNNLRPISHIVETLGHMFMNIAQDALPAFHEFTQTLDAWFTNWGDWIDRNPKKMQAFFNEGEQHLESWLKLAGAVIRLFAHITGAGGAEAGKGIVDSLTASVNRATKWIDSHNDKVQEFFHNVGIGLKIMANMVRVIAGAMLHLFNTERMENFARFVNHTLIPAIAITAEALGGIADVLLQLFNLPGFHQFGIALLTMTLTLKAMKGPFDLFAGGAGKFLKYTGRMYEAVKLLASGEGIGAAIKALRGLKVAQEGAAIATEAETVALAEQSAVSTIPGGKPRIRLKSSTMTSTVAKTAEKDALAGAEQAGIGGLLTKIGGSRLLGIAGKTSVVAGAAYVGGAWAKGIVEGFKTHDWKGAMEDVRHNVTLGLLPGKKDYTTIDKGITDDIDRINRVANQAAAAKKLGINMDVNFKTDDVNKNMDDIINQFQRVRDGAEGSIREARSDLNMNMKLIKHTLGTESSQAKDAMAANFQAVAQSIRNGMANGAISTKEGMKEINRLVRQALSVYGITGVQASRYLHHEDTLTGKPLNSPLVGKAEGGWIGRAGQRGRDTVVTALGHGEAVLNWAHQRMVEPAMRAYWGMGLNDMFRTRSAYHAGGPGDAVGFAKGGIVPIPGQGGNGTPPGVEYINSSIKNLVESLVKKYHLLITDAFDPTGTKHKSPGHEVTGTAVDFVPGPGGTWPLLEQMGAWAVKQGLVVGYDSHIAGAQHWPDHGRGNHIHIEFGSHVAASIAKAFQRIKLKHVDVGGAGFVHGVAQKATDRVRSAAQKRLDDIYDNMLGDGGPGMGVHPGGNAYKGGVLSQGQVHRLINQALDILHIKSSRNIWIQALTRQAYRESTFNPNAINNWDINAQRGDPSIGLLQVTGSNFRTYGVRGHGNIRNPLDNILASINYIRAAYGHGSYDAGAQAIWGRGGGAYDRGGEIPGHIGQAIGILAHGGEWILNKAQQAQAAAMAGLSPAALKSALGFGGGPTSFAAGGEVPSASAFAEELRKLLLVLRLQTGRFNVPSAARAMGTTTIGSVSGVSGDVKLNELQSAFDMHGVLTQLKYLDVSTKKGKKKFEEGLRSLNKDGGIFDRMSAAVTSMSEALTRNLSMRAFVVRAGKVKQVMSNTQMKSETLQILEDTYTGLVGEKGELNKALGANSAEMKRARQDLKEAKGDKAKKRARDTIKELQGFRTDLEGRVQDVQDSINENIQNRLQAQIDEQQSIVDEINKSVSKRSDTLNSAQRIASALGQQGIAASLADAQIELLKNQRDALNGRIQAARDAGATDLADQLESQVKDLNAQIVEATQAGIQAAIDRINNDAQRSLGKLDLFGRMADALGNVGLGGAGATIGGTTLTRAGIFAERGNILNNQMSALQDQLNAQNALPADQQNLTIIQSLGDQIDELKVAIQENTKASFNARVDEVNATADFSLTVNDLNKQLIEATAAAQGTTADPGKLAELLTQRAAYLATQLQGLSDLYKEAVANNDQAAMNDLTKQMLQVQIAEQENTKALNDVNGTLNQSQLSSTAWQQFRSAIFTSMGNLLPQYQIPAMGTPSMWGSSTIATKPQLVQQTVNEGDTNVYVTEPMEVLDADYVAHTIAFNRGGQG